MVPPLSPHRSAQPARGPAGGPEGTGPVSPTEVAALFALQVKDYVENSYYSNFISHLENVRYSGKGGQQRQEGGGGRNECVVVGGRGRGQGRVALVGRVADEPPAGR